MKKLINTFAKKITILTIATLVVLPLQFAEAKKKVSQQASAENSKNSSTTTSKGSNSSPPAATSATSEDRDALERLDASMERIGGQAHTKRIVSGSIFLGAGVGLGVWAIAANSSSDADVRAHAPAILGIAGGVSALVGTLILVFPSEFETLPEEFKALPESTDEERHRKVIRGESNLSHLAERAYHSRMWAGGTSVTLGGALTVLYATSEKKSSNNFLIYEGVILVGLGIMDFIVKSPAEVQSEEYKSWRSRRSNIAGLASLNVAPMVSDKGAGIGLVGRF